MDLTHDKTGGTFTFSSSTTAPGSTSRRVFVNTTHTTRVQQQYQSNVPNILMNPSSTASPISPSSFQQQQQGAKIVSSIPKVPSWLTDRIYMSNSYLTQKTYEPLASSPSHNQNKTQLFPQQVQEMILIDELLSAMLGFEGKYICIMRNRKTSDHSSTHGSASSSLGSGGSNIFSIPTRNDAFVDQRKEREEGLAEEFYLTPGAWEPSLSYLIQRILPICNKYLSISNFIQSRDCSYEYGLVSQAFVAAIKVIIQEYLTFVAQLESLFHKKSLTLQKIWLHIQQPLRTLTAVESLSREIHTCRAKGGKLLSITHKLSLILGGDSETQKLFHFLIEKACVPFFTMVNDWVHRGKLDDLYSEFMICYNTPEVNDTDPMASYWEKRFTIRKEQVPDFLTEAISAKILLSGKYLNVIRSASEVSDKGLKSTLVSQPSVTNSDKIDYTTQKREYVTKIDSAYASASQRIVKHILEEHKLLDLLNTMRDVFLFKKGDFFVHFIDNSESELTKKVSLIMPSKIQSLLELSLKTSTVKDVAGLTAELSPLPITAFLEAGVSINMTALKDTFALNGIEAFTIKPTITFPLSIVINNSNVMKYQLLFRHLLQCKCVERALLKAWVEHKYCREFSLGNSITPVYGLRQRMLHFVRELLFFSFSEIEKNFIVMQKKIKKSETLDEIIQYHQQFLDHCMVTSMLSLQKPFRALVQVLTVCKVFSDFMVQFTSGLTIEDEESDGTQKPTESTSATLAKRRAQIKIVSEHAMQNAQSQYHLNSIAKFNKNFEDSFQLLVDSLRASGGEASVLATHFADIFSWQSQ